MTKPQLTELTDVQRARMASFAQEWARRFPDALPQFVAPRPDCIIWIGALNQKGYGSSNLRGDRSGGVHRMVYEEFVGLVPEGMLIDHLCRVRSCINPDHLEPVTPAENTRRGLTNATKTSCKNEHEFTDENTYIGPDGQRSCRQCARDRRASWSPEKLEAARAASRERARRNRSTQKETVDA